MKINDAKKWGEWALPRPKLNKTNCTTWRKCEGAAATYTYTYVIWLLYPPDPLDPLAK